MLYIPPHIRPILHFDRSACPQLHSLNKRLPLALRIVCAIRTPGCDVIEAKHAELAASCYEIEPVFGTVGTDFDALEIVAAVRVD